MFLLSLPARGAWIEIPNTDEGLSAGGVAPREGSVDRNLLIIGLVILVLVAPREGSVDRNLTGVQTATDFLSSRSPRGERG